MTRKEFDQSTKRNFGDRIDCAELAAYRGLRLIDDVRWDTLAARERRRSYDGAGDMPTMTGWTLSRARVMRGHGLPILPGL